MTERFGLQWEADSSRRFEPQLDLLSPRLKLSRRSNLSQSRPDQSLLPRPFPSRVASHEARRPWQDVR